MDVQPPDFNTAPQILHLMQGAVENVIIDYGESASSSRPTGPLDPGEVLTGTPTISTLNMPSGASALTTGSVAVNSVDKYVNGRTASAGEAVQFTATASASQVRGLYRMLVTCSTDGGRTLKKVIRILVVDS